MSWLMDYVICTKNGLVGSSIIEESKHMHTNGDYVFVDCVAPMYLGLCVANVSCSHVYLHFTLLRFLAKYV
jgi:hypothetical protein